MGARARSYQGGAIFSFIIITVVVAALLVGGIFWLRHRGVAVREAQVASGSAAQSEGTKAPEGVSPDNDNSEGRSGNTPVESSDASRGGEKDDASVSSSSRSTAESKSDTAPAKEKATNTTRQPQDLPETGPGDTAAIAGILGLVAYMTTRYIVSRRELSRGVAVL